MEVLESIKYPMVPFGTVSSLKHHPTDMLTVIRQVSATGVELTPDQCLVFMVVQAWLQALEPDDEVFVTSDRTVWGKMTSHLLRHKLKVQFAVQMSDKSVQRRLRELADLGLLERKQLTKSRYDRAYYYRVPELSLISTEQ